MTFVTMVRDTLRKRAGLCLWIGSLFAANVLGAVGGLSLAVTFFIPTADDRAITLFVVGVVNGWLLRMLWTAITGKARRGKRSKPRRKVR